MADKQIPALPDRELARFWKYVEKSEQCWLWSGATTGRGYGEINIGGVMFAAHRVAWAIANGPIPSGRVVCHSCDVKACVRPDHLFLGSQADNMADYAAKGLAATHPRRAPNGSSHHNAALTETDVAEIRRRYSAGERQRSIAAHYGVSRGAIQHITRGDTWKHVTPQEAP